jgi:nitrate reductase delta subunit
MSHDTTGHLYRLFADLLEYPSPALARQAQQAAAGATMAQAATLLHGFQSFVEQASPAHLEELYTGTFDLQAVCYPYVGYHLFGDSYKRGMFMAQLNAGYREKGFSTGKELPDHVAVILRFLASVPEAERNGTTAPDDEFGQALLGEGLIPALNKMARAFDDQSDNPYAGVLRALLLVLHSPSDQVTGKE